MGVAQRSVCVCVCCVSQALSNSTHARQQLGLFGLNKQVGQAHTLHACMELTVPNIALLSKAVALSLHNNRVVLVSDVMSCKALLSCTALP